MEEYLDELSLIVYALRLVENLEDVVEEVPQVAHFGHVTATVEEGIVAIGILRDVVREVRQRPAIHLR